MSNNVFQILSFEVIPKLSVKWKKLGVVLDKIVFALWLLHLVVIAPMIIIHELLHILVMFCIGSYPSKCKVRVLWSTFDHYVVIIPSRRVESRRARKWVANIIWLIPLSAIVFPFIQQSLIIWIVYVMYCGIMDYGIISPTIIDKCYVENLSVEQYLERKEAIKT